MSVAFGYTHPLGSAYAESVGFFKWCVCVEEIWSVYMVQEDCFIPTLNKMGYMTRFLDVVQNNFIAYASQEPGGVSLDLGAAFGVATLPLLKKHQKRC